MVEYTLDDIIINPYSDQIHDYIWKEVYRKKERVDNDN